MKVIVLAVGGILAALLLASIFTAAGQMHQPTALDYARESAEMQRLDREAASEAFWQPVRAAAVNIAEVILVLSVAVSGSPTQPGYSPSERWTSPRSHPRRSERSTQHSNSQPHTPPYHTQSRTARTRPTRPALIIELTPAELLYCLLLSPLPASGRASPSC
jgi:hypothetical protein